MRNQLFQEPISTFVDQKIYEAKIHAEKLTDEQLEGPDLAQTLSQIAKFKFDVAALKSDQRKGKRRTEKRKIAEYGREIMVDVDFIDVTIPFEGWPKSFYIAPSSCAIIGDSASLIDQAILVSFPDDQSLDRNVDIFIERVNQNLDTLKNELQRIEPQMLQRAQLIANERLQKIRERRSRDKGRSFPIE